MKKIFLKYCKVFFTFLFIFILMMSSFYIEKIDAAVAYPFNGIIHADAAVIHSTPDTSAASSVTELVYGSKVIVRGIAANNSSMYEINYDDNKTGYVAKGLVTNIDTSILKNDAIGIETYSSYCSNLVKQGFHESYCPYLYYLHSKYPNWNFKADVIKETLNQTAENQKSMNVLETTNINYFLDPSILPIEGTYYYINSQTIASFIDPRNSLYEDRIFQFLDVESSKNIGGVVAMQNVTGSGFLNSYISTFLEAASSYGINPVHLIGRSTQEGANAKSSTYCDSKRTMYSGVGGEYTTVCNRTSSQGYSLDGYYNFYNIGSFVSGYYVGTVQRGLAYAAGFLEDDRCMSVDENGRGYYDTGKTYIEIGNNNEEIQVTCGALSYQRPWNTRELAILGGAEFLSNSYTKKGQDTVFFEKFNISSYTKYNLNTHQYMTNAYAPASESVTMYDAFKAEHLLDSNFNFIIPVYKNMENEITQPVNKSSNNKLSSIKINGELISGFDNVVVEYNVNLVTDNNSFEITATTDDSKAIVTGTGVYNFENGAKQVLLEVTAENGTKQTTKINVKQVLPIQEVKVEDIVNKMAVKVNSNFMYGISPGTAVSTIVNTAANNKGTASIVDSSGKIKNSGNLCTGDKVTISGTSQSVTYTIAINGDINGDGVVKINDLILLQSHILDKNKLTNEKYYAADINNDSNLKINDLILIQSYILGKASL